MKLRRKSRQDDEVIDLTDGANAWWAAADHLVTVAPSYPRPGAQPPPTPPKSSNPWAPELVYTWGQPDPHDVLGVTRDASWGEIERARRRLAKAHHPDLASDAGPVEIDLRERRMRAVNQAYEEIKQARQLAGLD